MKTANRLDLDKEFAKLMQQGGDVKRDVQRLVDNLVAVIKAKRQNILSSLEKETRRSLDLVTERKTEIQRQITAIESSLENADKLLTRSSWNRSIKEIIRYHFWRSWSNRANWPWQQKPPGWFRFREKYKTVGDCQNWWHWNFANLATHYGKSFYLRRQRNWRRNCKPWGTIYFDLKERSW